MSPVVKKPRDRIKLTGGGTLNIYAHRQAGIPQMSQLLQQQTHGTWLHLRSQGGPGYEHLRLKYPHLAAQLEILTCSWLLAGKNILVSKEVLADYLSHTKELLTILQRAPLQMPDTVTPEESLSMYRQQMRKLLAFLEKDVLPVLPNAPVRKVVGVSDGQDLDEPDGEESMPAAETGTEEKNSQS